MKTKYIGIILLSLILCNVHNINAENTLYTQFLKQEHYIEDTEGHKYPLNYYVIGDLNNDNIEDLVLINKDLGSVNLYTIKNNKVIPVPFIVEEAFIARNYMGIEENNIRSQDISIEINNKTYHLAYTLLNYQDFYLYDQMKVGGSYALGINELIEGGINESFKITFSLEPKETTNNKYRDMIYKKADVYIYQQSLLFDNERNIEINSIYNKLYTLKKEPTEVKLEYEDIKEIKV